MTGNKTSNRGGQITGLLSYSITSEKLFGNGDPGHFFWKHDSKCVRSARVFVRNGHQRADLRLRFRRQREERGKFDPGSGNFRLLDMESQGEQYVSDTRMAFFVGELMRGRNTQFP
jgi:hypothetical protein